MPRQCWLVTNDKDIAYDASPLPWELDSHTYAATPSAPAQCNFLRLHVVAHLRRSIHRSLKHLRPATVWTPQADHTLSVVWSHSRLHSERHATWTRNHHHEVLSVLLGYRVSQHDLLARLKYLKNSLPRCWVAACIAASSSAAVTDVFDTLNAKWEGFMGNFDHWDDYVSEDSGWRGQDNCE
jgi:hypothetical protein